VLATLKPYSEDLMVKFFRRSRSCSWLVMERCGGKSRLAGVSVADMRYIRAAAQFHMMKIA